MIHRQPILLSLNGVHGGEELARVVRNAMDLGFDGIEFEPDQDQAPMLGEKIDSFACVASVNCTSLDLDTASKLVSASLYHASTFHVSSLILRLPPLGGFQKNSNTSVENQNEIRILNSIPMANFSPGAATLGVEKNLSDEFEHYEDALNFADALLRSVRFNAEQAGVPLALVVGDGGCFLSPVEVRELLDRAQTWAVGACLDQAILDGIGRLDDWFETLGHRVLCVRLSNITTLDHATSLTGKGYGGPIVVPENTDPARLRSALSMTGSGTD